MPTFDTPEPIAVDVRMADGRVNLIASDRTDTVVRVDVGLVAGESEASGAGRRVRVDLVGTTLEIRTPSTGLRRLHPVAITIELPSRSTLLLRAGSVEVRATGILGACRLDGADTRVALEHTGDLEVNAADALMDIGQVAGSTKVKSAKGELRFGDLAGGAVVQSGRCAVTVGRAGDGLNIASAGGDISVGRAEASVTVRTAHSSIRVGEAARGRIDLATGIGDIEVGIRPGSAAWLDAFSKHGGVRNHLPSREGPGNSTERVEVRTRTRHGDITIHAAPTATPAADGHLAVESTHV